MKTVIYVGTLEVGIMVDPQTGTPYQVERGVPFEVPEELAATLGPDYQPADEKE